MVILVGTMRSWRVASGSNRWLWCAAIVATELKKKCRAGCHRLRGCPVLPGERTHRAFGYELARRQDRRAPRTN